MSVKLETLRPDEGRAEAEKLFEEKRPAWTHGVWWNDTSKLDVKTSRLNAFLGVFCRRTINQDVSAPCPLPDVNPGFYAPSSVGLPLVADPRRKEHAGILTYMLSPLGFQLVIREGSNKEKPYEEFADAIGKAEFRSRTAKTPRPSFDASLWYAHIENYAQHKSSLASHWRLVLGKEWCIERPDMSFIFGASRNPVTPLITHDAKDSAYSDHKIYSAHLPRQARSRYLLHVVLQAWLAINQRWAVENVRSPVRFQHQNIFSVDANDFTIDAKEEEEGRAETRALLDARPYSELEEMSRSVASAIALQPKPEQRVALRQAHEFASMASRLTFGRFYVATWRRLYPTKESQEQARADMEDPEITLENLKRNVINQFTSSKFTRGEITNILEPYKQGMRTAKLMLDAAQYVKHGTERRRFRTVADSDGIKLDTLSKMYIEPKACVPSIRNRLCKTLRHENDVQEDPLFFAHLFFSPAAPVCTWPDTAAAEADEQKSLTAKNFHAFYWSIVNYLNKDAISELDHYVTSKNLVVATGKRANHASSKSYFANRANEDESVLLRGGRARYATYNVHNHYVDSYALPDHIQGRALEDKSVPTKFKAQVSRKQEQQPDGPLTTALARDKAVRGVHDPRLQSIPVFRHHLQFVRSTHTERMTQLSHALALAFRHNRDTSSTAKKTVMYYIYLDLCSEFSEIETLSILLHAEIVSRHLNSSPEQQKAALSSLEQQKLALDRLGQLWEDGLAMLEIDKIRALGVLAAVSREPSAAAVDYKAVRSVGGAFERHRRTYAEQALVSTNVDFHARFFTRQRVLLFLDAVFFEIRTHDAKPVIKKRMDPAVSDIVEVLASGATLISGLKPDSAAKAVLGARKQGTTTPLFYSTCGLPQLQGLPLSGHAQNYAGYNIARHIIDLWVAFVKQPVFFYAAYVANPPCGAVLAATECEWPKMTDDTKCSDIIAVGSKRPAESGVLDVALQDGVDTPHEKKIRRADVGNVSSKFSDAAFEGLGPFIRFSNNLLSSCTTLMKKKTILSELPRLLDRGAYEGPHATPFHYAAFFCLATSFRTAIADAQKIGPFERLINPEIHGMLLRLIGAVGYTCDGLRPQTVTASDTQALVSATPGGSGGKAALPAPPVDSLDRELSDYAFTETLIEHTDLRRLVASRVRGDQSDQPKQKRTENAVLHIASRLLFHASDSPDYYSRVVSHLEGHIDPSWLAALRSLEKK